MVERQNYLKVKLFLKYMEEVQQVSNPRWIATAFT